MNDLSLFRAIGAALYGPQWQGEMARQLNVNPTTLQRWVNGRFAIPLGIWNDLLPLVVARRAELDDLLLRLEEATSTSTSNE